MENHNPKSFWKRPEGVTGILFLVAGLSVLAYFGFQSLALIQQALTSTLGIMGAAALVAALLFLAFDRRTRNLIGYGYKSIMRWITGLFVQLDPIAILKNYLDDMKKSLRDMNKQIGVLRGQMQRLERNISDNQRDIDQSMKLAQRAKAEGNEPQMTLNLRKAARLKDSNAKLDNLRQRIQIMLRVLVKMHDNSQILYEDTKDQIMVKEQERKAIRASHSAMQSAMNIINGNNDQRALFDQAMEALADDVANKVGEMERFMDVSKGFMDSIDLQSGVFEEEGLKMLEEWERTSTSQLLGTDDVHQLLNSGQPTLDLNDSPSPRALPRHKPSDSEPNSYKDLFE